MAGEAETVLNMVQYHGEKRQWNFEKYALMPMESDSGSDGEKRKHSALTCQGTVPRKAGRKGGAGKS